MLLHTERLVLREFVRSDWRAVLRYQAHPLYLRYTPWTERTEADVRSFVNMFLSWQRERPRLRFQFAMELDGQLIGNCGIRTNMQQPWEANIGYELDSRYWGRGYATEAARELLRFGFEELRFHRICAQCIAENLASAHVLERIGMKREGHLRENEWMRGRWWDTLEYAILESEWKALYYPANDSPEREYSPLLYGG
ncbi:RimJ/RimL family protein N-acetyltransferase [Thermosporothrix hazakensis]|jgi:RimJ/RimL family protein N-acetyltransferase|uniref:RimJ/RimL family protein N-acetyltransferase n=2 Tax=Thermosporothrix TaxID=768650 RepID=A0A326UFH2_THEHA|nr:GNAT family protein [Thermosporothrix hazakensis]PZW25649.1 RimJ/RimL family protein N-acetyltransferase [Thermosporothrix hazakensis]BBH89945.1 ribosomal-protein-serine acetyltransferase [Thermosporothrix sp. COM3]GCE48144.1 ribosomal-protein-serine acetyltransferase [Thermosporothrix hazakensis]